MRAAVYYGNRDIRIQDVAEPEPVAGEVLLRVTATGICGTDASEYATGPRMYPIGEPNLRTGHAGPMIPGHEVAGVIEALGPGVQTLGVGDLVVTGAGIACGECDQCARGRTNLCERYATVGLQRHGGLAELVAVPASTVVRAPEGITGDAAALGQPMAIAVHSMRQGRPVAGEVALVLGVGGIGAFLTYALAASGVRVVAADLDDERLRIARALGAERSVRPEGSDGRGALVLAVGAPDVVYEVTGSASGFADAFEVVRPGGRIVAVGLHDRPRSVDLRSLTLREVSVIGTNAHVVSSDLPEALRLIAARTDSWRDVAPTALSLDRLVPDGIEPLVAGTSPRIKTLVDPSTPASRPTRMRLGEEVS